jgi:lactoylglutathione lyase
MRTLHVGLRVSDLQPSLAFYRALGYTVTGTVEGTPFGSLTMLQLPGDPFVAIELVHDPAKGTVDLGTGISHLVIRVESLNATLADLAVKGIAADPPADPGHADRPRTSWITDPDGYRIELGPVAGWPRRRHHQGRLPRADGPRSPASRSLTATPTAQSIPVGE